MVLNEMMTTTNGHNYNDDIRPQAATENAWSEAKTLQYANFEQNDFDSAQSRSEKSWARQDFDSSFAYTSTLDISIALRMWIITQYSI